METKLTKEDILQLLNRSGAICVFNEGAFELDFDDACEHISPMIFVTSDTFRIILLGDITIGLNIYKTSVLFDNAIEYLSEPTDEKYAEWKEIVTKHVMQRIEKEKAAQLTIKENTLQTSGFVYFVQLGDSYKLGRSKNVENRFKCYTELHPDIKILRKKYVHDMLSAEKELLSMFPEKLIHGKEWFRFTDEEVAKILEIFDLS